MNNGEVIRTTVIATFAVNFSYLRNSPFIYPPVDPPTCEDPPTPIDPPTPPTPEDPPTPIDPVKRNVVKIKKSHHHHHHHNHDDDDDCEDKQ